MHVAHSTTDEFTAVFSYTVAAATFNIGHSPSIDYDPDCAAYTYVVPPSYDPSYPDRINILYVPADETGMHTNGLYMWSQELNLVSNVWNTSIDGTVPYLPVFTNWPTADDWPREPTGSEWIFKGWFSAANFACVRWPWTSMTNYPGAWDK
jgi:hypothetical protein